jgi:hypothetical protein
VCSNGLVISQQELISLNQRHMKISMDEVEMITETFIKSTPVIERSVNRMSEIKMDTDKQVDFATKAMGIRWKNTEDISTMTIDSILNPIRLDDMDPTLWNTFNVVQEKLIRGGFVKQQSNKSRQVKPITSLTMDTMINQKLWELAESYI